MKRQTIWKKYLSLAVIALTFILAGNIIVSAQKFKPGDRVECDPTAIGDWMKASVIAYQEKDNPVFQGEYYLTRVVIDKWKSTYPEGVLCQTERVRSIKEQTANPPQKQPPTETNEKQKNQPNENETETNEPGVKFNPGERVECDAAGINVWLKGTVLPFEKNDKPGLDKDKSGKFFYIHRVRLDRDASTRPEGGMCFTDRTRLLAGGKPMEIPKTDLPIGKVTVDENNTLSADRPIIECPIGQKPVKNGASPNVELLKKIVRCRKGEIAASKGMDGAVTVEVTALQLGATRQWIYSRDIGGKPGTLIHPVKVTYTVKTFYRSRTDVSQNWIRILNFYVNEFGEWTVGSEEPIKIGERIDVPRLP